MSLFFRKGHPLSRNYKLSLYVFGLILTTSLLGCDVISSIKEYFSKSDKNTTAAQTEQTAPVVSQPVTPSGEVKQEEPIAANVLARVGNWKITIDEFNERLKALKDVVQDFDVTEAKNKAAILDELVNQQLLVLEAEKNGLANDKDVFAAIEEFRRTVLVREAARKLTESITVTDEEAKAFYDENKAQLMEPPQYHVREIVVDTQNKAKELLADILKGADFAETAKANSKGKTAAQGGDLGFLKEEPFPQMVTALLSMNVGDSSSVLKGPDGFYIVKLEEKKESKQVSFESIKKDIVANRTAFKQQQAILNHIDQLRAKTKVDINKELLK